MHTATVAVLVIAAAAAPARADHVQANRVQADLGLTVVAVAYEQPITDHVALAVEGGLFGTYFLPWFDLGDNVVGGIGGVRTTWFPTGHLYVTPYLRAGYAGGKHEDGNGVRGDAAAVTAGAFVGWVFEPTDKIDLRVGAGAQYIYLSGTHGLEASTPFVALDFTVGYRL